MILFLAPIFTEQILKNHRATSPAASLWCSTFAKNLNKYEDVHCLSAVNNYIFPIGELFVDGYSYCDPVPTKMVNYISLPMLRYYIINKNIIHEIDVIMNHHKINYVITYNTTYINVNIAQYLQNRGVRWISIYADANNDKQLLSKADYHLYFSNESFRRSNYKNKLNFEGAIYKNVQDVFIENDNKVFLYTGVIRKENGVDLMLDAFKTLGDKDAILKICGKGNYTGFLAKVKSDSRIHYLEMVDNEELIKLYEEASYYLNPRLSEYIENANNFPSKILDYLSYAKPIISTKTKGINPIYYNYLYLLEKENISGLSDMMRQMLNLTLEEKRDLYQKIKKFANQTHSWNIRINELWSWLGNRK